MATQSRGRRNFPSVSGTVRPGNTAEGGRGPLEWGSAAGRGYRQRPVGVNRSRGTLPARVTRVFELRVCPFQCYSVFSCGGVYVYVFVSVYVVSFGA